MAYSLCQHIRQIMRQSAHIKTCYLHSSGLSISGVIQISPSISLFDQNILIKLQSLPRNAKVTLFARVEQDWRRSPAVFASCSHHVTSDSGCVDLEKDASMGGTYTGVDSMGLFWSMQPNPLGPQNIRLVIKNVEQPVTYNLSIYSDHLCLNDLFSPENALKPLCKTKVERLPKSLDVKRVPIKEGGIRGTLFLPPGSGPHQGVIDIFGLAGGLMEMRGALLASHGFTTLSLPFLRYSDLPSQIHDVKLDYFEEAARWMSGHKSVKRGGIGVIGVSGGCLFATMMGWKCPEVIAVVRINGPPFQAFLKPLLHKGKPLLSCAEFDFDLTSTENGALAIKNAFVYKSSHFIPTWESSTHFLTLTSDDDEQIKPELSDDLLNMYPADKRHLMQVIHYPGAGHLLEPPYSPHCRSCYNQVFDRDLLWGGNLEDHAKAQIDSWPKILNFFRSHLPQ